MEIESHEGHDQQAKQTIVENIEKYGCHLALLESDNYMPAFAYSIGLYQKYNHPEIICFGLATDLMRALLNHARDLVQAGENLTTGKLYTGFLDGHNICFIPVDKAFYPDYLGYGEWFYNMNFDFPVLQLVWPDKAGKLPWNEDFNKDWKFNQPLLDRNTDFKFYEERNLGVYTTKKVLEGEPILYAYHDENGDWQFHSSADPDINNAKLVSLESITKLDPTINEIYFLQYGWKAWRNEIGDEWYYEDNSSK